MMATLEHLAQAPDVEQVWNSLLIFADRFGFDRLIYGFTRFRTANSYGDPADMLLLSNHDSAFLNPFMKDGLYFHGPMVRWAAENTGACSWRWIQDQATAGRLTPEEQSVLRFNRAHDVTAGYTISFPNVSVRSKGALGLTARRGLTQDDVDAVWEAHGREILVVANVAHLKISSLPYAGTARKLTKRQREVLEWVGDGKTAQDIAAIVGVSPATVEKHLRLARETLGVETTAQAVLKASFQNQIFTPQIPKIGVK